MLKKIIISILIISIILIVYLYKNYIRSPIDQSEIVISPIPSQVTDSSPEKEKKALNNTIKPSVKKSENFIKQTPKIDSNQSEIMAWIYPGSITCRAMAEYSDGRRIDVLKPEYFNINEEGKLILLTEENSGCNGFSVNNILSLKKYSKEQYVTVSSSYAVSMNLFLTQALVNKTDINMLVDFVISNNMTGVEIDFEDFGGWNDSIYKNYKEFITNLGNELHAKNKKLIIDMPATSNEIEKAWYVWRYSDLNLLPIDRLVIMTYDYQYDQGVGQPVSPLSWIEESIKLAKKEFSNTSKLTFGVPSYGYRGIVGTQKFTLLTYEQIKKEPGFVTAKRDESSSEMTWQNGEYIYFYQDAQSISKKIETINNSGISSISIWHLGGNLWFN